MPDPTTVSGLTLTNGSNTVTSGTAFPPYIVPGMQVAVGTQISVLQSQNNATALNGSTFQPGTGTGTLYVLSTAGAVAGSSGANGFLWVQNSNGYALVSYTGSTGTTFTGCTVGFGGTVSGGHTPTLATGNIVTFANSLPLLSTTLNNGTTALSTFVGGQTLTVASTTNAPSTGGYLFVQASDGPAIMEYGAVGSATTFTNCTTLVAPTSNSALVSAGSCVLGGVGTFSNPWSFSPVVSTTNGNITSAPTSITLALGIGGTGVNFNGATASGTGSLIFQPALSGS